MKEKRANGEGSLRQRPDGRWEYRVTVEGRATPLSFYSMDADGRGAKKKYRAWLKENINVPQVERNELVKNWAQRWLTTKKAAVAYKTYENYAFYIDRFILPAIGDMKLNAVRPYHVEDIFTGAAALSHSARNEIKVCLNGIFKTAKRNHLCVENPVEDISLHRDDPKPPKIHPIDEVRRILDYTPSHKWGSYVELALYTGLRSEELCGLMWSDVHLQEGTVHIHQVVAEVENSDPAALMKPDKNGKVCRRRKYELVSTTKSKHSRAVVLNQEGIAAFRRLRKESLYVLPGPDGAFLTPPLFAQRYAAVLRALNRTLEPNAQVQILSPHKARHTYASALLKNGANIKAVQEQLGHTKIGTTQIYLHLDLNDRKDNVKKLAY